MKVFAARLIRPDGPQDELPATRIVFVLADTLKDAYAAFLTTYPDWLVEMTDHEPSARLVAELKPGVPE